MACICSAEVTHLLAAIDRHWGAASGMDPYLEKRNVWPDVHSVFIVATRDALALQVAPAYEAAPATTMTSVVQTVVLPQCEEVHERYLEIRDVRTHVVITALVILSPSHKTPDVCSAGRPYGLEAIHRHRTYEMDI